MSKSLDVTPAEKRAESVLYKAGRKEIKASMTFSRSACVAGFQRDLQTDVMLKRSYSTRIIRILPYLAGGTSDSASEYA